MNELLDGLIFDFYYDINERCSNCCNFYPINKYQLRQIFENLKKENPALTYPLAGQNLCVKHKVFKYFNESCSDFVAK